MQMFCIWMDLGTLEDFWVHFWNIHVEFECIYSRYLYQILPNTLRSGLCRNINYKVVLGIFDLYMERQNTLKNKSKIRNFSRVNNKLTTREQRIKI